MAMPTSAIIHPLQIGMLFLFVTADAAAGGNDCSELTVQECYLEGESESTATENLYGLWSDNANEIRAEWNRRFPPGTISDGELRSEDLLGPRHAEILQYGRVIFVVWWLAPVEIGLSGMQDDVTAEAYCVIGKRLCRIVHDRASCLTAGRCGDGAILPDGDIELPFPSKEGWGYPARLEGPEGRQRLKLGRVLPDPEEIPRLKAVFERQHRAWSAIEREHPEIQTLRNCPAGGIEGTGLDDFWIDMARGLWGLRRFVSFGNIALSLGYMDSVFMGHVRQPILFCIRGRHAVSIVGPYDWNGLLSSDEMGSIWGDQISYSLSDDGLLLEMQSYKAYSAHDDGKVVVTYNANAQSSLRVDEDGLELKRYMPAMNALIAGEFSGSLCEQSDATVDWQPACWVRTQLGYCLSCFPVGCYPPDGNSR